MSTKRKSWNRKNWTQIWCFQLRKEPVVSFPFVASTHTCMLLPISASIASLWLFLSPFITLYLYRSAPSALASRYFDFFIFFRRLWKLNNFFSRFTNCFAIALLLLLMKLVFVFVSFVLGFVSLLLWINACCFFRWLFVSFVSFMCSDCGCCFYCIYC